MTANEFRELVRGAVAGDHDALELILRLYMPLVGSTSSSTLP